MFKIDYFRMHLLEGEETLANIYFDADLDPDAQ